MEQLELLRASLMQAYFGEKKSAPKGAGFVALYGNKLKLAIPKSMEQLGLLRASLMQDSFGEKSPPHRGWGTAAGGGGGISVALNGKNDKSN